MIIKTLELIKVKIESLVPIPEHYTISKGNQNGFEELLATVLEEVKNDNEINFEYKLHLGHHFPDVDIYLLEKKYGLELKSRNNGQWTTNGNSVFESITSTDYEEVYILFGSLNQNEKRYIVKYAPYWQVTSDIKVTHSPRFSINMETQDSVFENSESYHFIRNSTEQNKVLFLQEYLKDKAKGTRWYISPDTPEVAPIHLKNVDKAIKNRVIMESVILYPQDYFRSKDGKRKINSDYTRAAEYVIANYFYYSTSFRDYFSAGGIWEYQNNQYPKFFKKINDNRLIIDDILINSNENFKLNCLESWKDIPIQQEQKPFKIIFYEIIDYLGEANFPNHVRNLPEGKLSSLLSIA